MKMSKIFVLGFCVCSILLDSVLLGQQTNSPTDFVSKAKSKIAAKAAVRGIFASGQFKDAATYYLPDGTPRVYAFVYHTEDGNDITTIASATRKDVPVIMTWKGLPRHETAMKTAMEKIAEESGIEVTSYEKVIWLDIYDVWLQFKEIHPETGSPITYNLYDNKVSDLATVTSIWENQSTIGTKLSSMKTDPAVGSSGNLDTIEQYRNSCWNDFDNLVAIKESSEPNEFESLKQTPAYSYTKYLENVPNFNQGANPDCGIVAAMDIILYWDKRGYEQLVDGDDFSTLRSDLRTAMGYTGSGTTDTGTRDGIDDFCNSAAFGNNYSFTANLDDLWPAPYWSDFKTELDSGRPVMLGVQGYSDDPINPTDSSYGDHWVCAVGYYEGTLWGSTTTKWCIVHDNWGGGTYTDPYILDDEPYIDWTRATDCIIRVTPGGTANYPDLYDKGEDWRSFSPQNINAGQNFSISCDIRNGGSGDAGPHTVTFYASSNTTISTSDYYIGEVKMEWIDSGQYKDCDWSGSFPSNIPNGSYWIGWIIDSGGDVPESNSSNNIAYKTGYQLTMSTDDSYEENDSLSAAYGINEQTWLSDISGLGIQADDDWYKVYVSSGYERVLIDCRFTHANGDIDISLYDSSGTKLADSASSSDNEYIDICVPTGGTYYYIRVYYGNAGNTYNLWWDDQTGCDSTDPYEENDTMADAYDLSSHENTWLSNISGLALQEDTDWYKINVGCIGLVTIDCQFTDADGDIDIALYDSSGMQLASSRSTSDNEQIVQSVSPGVYYIKVFYGNAGNSYDLRWIDECGSGGCVISVETFSIDDDTIGGSNGNGDGIVNPGEVIELRVQLQNTGTSDAHSVSAHLETTDPYVTGISDADEDYGDIMSNSSAWCVFDYDFTVSPSCPDGHTITFNLDPITATEGTWTDTIQITVQGGGSVVPQSIPYTQTFDSGLPEQIHGWEYSSSDTGGRIVEVNGRLRMYREPSGTYTRNEATLHLDLSGQSNVLLNYFQAESDDEIHLLLDTFSGTQDGDGVLVSNDGVNWHQVTNAQELAVGSTGKVYSIELDKLEIPYSSDFRIKFQQYDNYAWSSDGREFDDISVIILKPDINQDGVVNLNDYVFFAVNWMKSGCSSSNNWCDGADLNNNASVDISDLMLFCEHWLESSI